MAVTVKCTLNELVTGLFPVFISIPRETPVKCDKLLDTVHIETKSFGGSLNALINIPAFQ